MSELGSAVICDNFLDSIEELKVKYKCAIIDNHSGEVKLTKPIYAELNDLSKDGVYIKITLKKSRVLI